MTNMFNDPDFLETTFVTVDFETLTPAGRKPEPIEIALVGQRFRYSPSEGSWQKTTVFDSLIKPPEGVPVTKYTVQTGITAKMLVHAPPAAAVMGKVEEFFLNPPYVLVAHNAIYEASLIFEQRQHCPHLARIPLLDTVRLARLVYPELPRHQLDGVLAHAGIPLPEPRHRAMPDTIATAALFTHLIEAGNDRGLWSTLEGITELAGVIPKVLKLEAEAAKPQQGTLFD